MRLHVVDHPLVSHKLTALRDERTASPEFRRLTEELVTLLAYEATRDVRVEDVDAVVSKAVDGGATITEEVEDKFWGDRFGTIRDPFGHVWSIGTHVEDVPPQQMAERAKSAMAAMSA